MLFILYHLSEQDILHFLDFINKKHLERTLNL
jgi:hypothetical protein